MATGLHEEYTRDYHVEAASNKRFGLIVGGIALAFGCIRAYLHGEVGIVAGLLGGVGLGFMEVLRWKGGGASVPAARTLRVPGGCDFALLRCSFLCC